MSDDKLTVMAFKSKTGDAAQRPARPGESEQTRQRTATRPTVGIYERPAQRKTLSLPLIIILILASLISLVISVRFLF